MNICFAKNLFAMQQTESSAGQVDVAGQLSSQMCSQYPEFECLGEDVLDALEGGRENGSFIKTDIVFDSQEEAFFWQILLQVHIFGKRRGDIILI